MAKTMIMDGSNCRRVVSWKVIMVALLSASNVSAFTVPASTTPGWGCKNTAMKSAVAEEVAVKHDASAIISMYESQMEKLSEKDKTSTSISKDDLKVVFEDEHLVVVDKPSGVLSVCSNGNPSIAQTVFEKFGCESGNVDKMVVHRLGMDTSGLMVFAKTNQVLLLLNAQFRTRKVSRKYEALLGGNVADDTGKIELPLMRDPLNPPYMRVSDDDQQRALIGLEDELPEAIAKKLLALPKPSVTTYEVISREESDGQPVTRVSMTSVSGRTHQLNVHAAAIGHSIVADSVYGNAVEGKNMCVHAKHLSFQHPITREALSFESPSPF